MPTETINYDLSGEMPLRVYSLLDQSFEQVVLPPGALLPGPSPVDTSTLDKELYVNHRLEGTYDNHVHFAIVNEQADNGSITVLNYGWGGKIHSADNRANLIELVAANPDRRFLVYDNLGHGQSSNISRNVRREIAATGRFDIYAFIILGALSRVLADYNQVEMVGVSEGGLVATELAAQMDSVESLVVFDTPLTELGFMGLSRAFWIKEAEHGGHYSDLAAGITGVEQKSKADLAKQSLKDVAVDILKGRIPAQVNEAQGIALGKYGEVLPQALTKVSGRYVLLSPRQSELNSPRHARSVLRKAVATASYLPDSVQHVTFNGTHAFGFGNPRAVAALESFGLSYPFSVVKEQP